MASIASGVSSTFLQQGYTYAPVGPLSGSLHTGQSHVCAFLVEA